MLKFAGNMLQVRNDKGETFLVMSEQAYKSLTINQIEKIKSHTIHFGNIVDDENVIDEVLVSVFKNPHSYTGEDVIELIRA